MKRRINLLSKITIISLILCNPIRYIVLDLMGTNSNIKKLQALDSFFSALFAILLILSMICIFIEVRMEKRNKIYTVAILLTSLCLGAYGFYLLLQTIQPYLI